MNVQTLVTDFSAKAQKLASTGQEAAVIGFDTLKTANDIVVEAAQALAKAHTDAGLALYGGAKVSFEKASKDGIKAVLANPQGYVPATEPAVEAFQITVKTLSETGMELAKTFEGGFQQVVAKFNGETLADVAESVETEVKAAAAPVVQKAKATVKKAKGAVKA